MILSLIRLRPFFSPRPSRVRIRRIDLCRDLIGLCSCVRVTAAGVTRAQQMNILIRRPFFADKNHSPRAPPPTPRPHIFPAVGTRVYRRYPPPRSIYPPSTSPSSPPTLLQTFRSHFRRFSFFRDHRSEPFRDALRSLLFFFCIASVIRSEPGSNLRLSKLLWPKKPPSLPRPLPGHNVTVFDHRLPDNFGGAPVKNCSGVGGQNTDY